VSPFGFAVRQRKGFLFLYFQISKKDLKKVKKVVDKRLKVC